MHPLRRAWPQLASAPSLIAFSLLVLLRPAIYWAQTAVVNTGASVVAGRVSNALSGVPVPRVLVQMGSRAALTDHEGRFRFTGVAGDLSSLQINKPGYALSAEQLEPASVSLQNSSDPTAVEIQIYPEALLTGTVLGPDGSPLPNLFVSIRRSLFTETGHYLIPAAHVRTDSQGNFRAPVPAGDYVLQTDYARDLFATDLVILPQSIPASSLGDPAMIHVRSGEEVQLDFRPPMVQTHKVALDLGGDRYSLPARLSIRSTIGYTLPQTGGGGRSRGTSPATLDLPSGTFIVEAVAQTSSGEQSGQAVITVTDRDTTAGTLHYSATPTVPIELSVDTSTPTVAQNSTNLPPTIQQLGLSLRNLQAAVDGSASYDIQPAQLSDRSTVFRATPGRYRLHAANGTAWFIESATFGSSNVLQEELVLGPGAGASPLRLVVSEATGSLAGTVRFHDHPASAWIYLVAATPSASPVGLQRSTSDGVFTFSRVPPGTYLAVAFEHRHSANLLDTNVMASFASRVQTVQVQAGARSSLTLDTVPARELLK